MAWKRIGNGTPDSALRYSVPIGQARALTLGQKVGNCRVTRIDRKSGDVDLMPMKECAAYFDSRRTTWAE